ncbi:hypothetical protein Sango_2094800 [Sesamum angolense]|uniref:Gag-pol polyprotein n=1 Tax=Sesamum angolense TaxID=2727404 RepID=A0AAE1WBL9_9LAMI|nr:hypothetical protein Sango_2094800 [Sesamum angolense]
MDKLLPQTLPDGSSFEEREMFESWHADHHKVRSIILASMSNDVQKQYDRLDDVAPILQRMKEVYVILDGHTRYVATKEFFRAKMTEGSSMQEHGVKMLSLVDKLEDLKAGLENDTYIDVILQSLPPSYDPFIVNFNMNGLESGNGQGKEEDGYSAVVEGKRYCREKGHWKRDCPNLSSNQGMFVVKVNMITNSASWVLDTGCGAHICNDLQMLQRSRKLSKDEVVLKLGDGKTVAAEAVGIINLVISDRVRLGLKDCYFVSSMIKNIISIP